MLFAADLNEWFENTSTKSNITEDPAGSSFLFLPALLYPFPEQSLFTVLQLCKDRFCFCKFCFPRYADILNL